MVKIYHNNKSSIFAYGVINDLKTDYMIQSLRDFRYQGIGLSIENYRKYPNGWVGVGKDPTIEIVLRLTNHTKQSRLITLNGSRNISKLNGILDIDHYEPYAINYCIDRFRLAPEAFVDAYLEFHAEDVTEGDRFEIKLNDATVVIQNMNNTWDIIDFYEVHSLSDPFSNTSPNIRFEHLEALEEQVGISLQNFSVQSKCEGIIQAYCEILSVSKMAKSSFWIVAAAYDIDNKVIGYARELIDPKDFLGFSVLSFRIDLSKSSSSVERILFYPSL